MALIVRKESDGLRRYVHLGTGNYNPVNARIYTDYSFFSCREEITNDASEVFNFLTGYSKKEAFAKLAVAPITLREKITTLIEREANHARNGKEARLILKINSLTDQKIIEQLYAASKAGVKIDLIIRGICCLRPGIAGVSENIRVISIVGRYLEHSRVFWFNNDGSSELFMSSADLMGRNLDRRVELMFPIDDPLLAKQVLQESLEGPLKDNVASRILHPDGSYTRLTPNIGENAFESQKMISQSRLRNIQQIKLIPRDFPQKS